MSEAQYIFKKYPKIYKKHNVRMSITQKIHGSNAQIIINNIGDDQNPIYDVKAGSRSRVLYLGDDNFGFARFVNDNKLELAMFFGEGIHYGEWAGKGINSSEGLDDKYFVSFEWYLFKDNVLPPSHVMKVPVLYDGNVDFNKINDCMDDLKTNGSKLVKGFMRPEGVVVDVGEQKLKYVFDNEETKWQKNKGINKGINKKEFVDYSHLCQLLRLEKLLSRDEKYIREYPRSLKDIVKDYVHDLIDEEQITGDSDKIKAIKKGASQQIFKFIKSVIEK